MSIEKYADNLGPPDITLDGLQIWIHGRQYPNEEDYWDGNWLNVTAHCGSQGADVWTNGDILHVPDLARWLADLEIMNQTLSGGADLVSLEPELSVELKMSGLGHIEMKVEITPDHMGQQHSFQFELDQSCLPELIASCRMLLAKYPIRGKPDSEDESEQALAADRNQRVSHRQPASSAVVARPLKRGVGWLLNLMSIDIFWESERGEILEKCSSWFNPWKYMDHPDELDGTCCLRFIDEYGDTTFNQYHLPVLIQELESILPRSKDAAAKESLESLIAFVRKCEAHVHTYVKFVGD